LVSVLQDGQHIKKNLKLHVDEYITQTKSPYLFRSLTFQLLDILIWFKNFIDQNPEPEQNKKLWKELNKETNMIEGKCININKEGWGTFQPADGSRNLDIPDFLISKHNINLHDEIKIKTELKGNKTLIYIC